MFHVEQFLKLIRTGPTKQDKKPQNKPKTPLQHIGEDVPLWAFPAYSQKEMFHVEQFEIPKTQEQGGVI